MGATTIRRFSSIEEALVVQSLLIANGIDTNLDCGQHAQNDWFLLHALGGVGIMVRSDVATEADKLIRGSLLSGAETLEREFGPVERRRLKRRVLRRWSLPFVFFGGPNLFLLAIIAALIVVFPQEPSVETVSNHTNIARATLIPCEADCTLPLDQFLNQINDPWEYLVIGYHSFRSLIMPSLEFTAFYLFLITAFSSGVIRSKGST